MENNSTIELHMTHAFCVSHLQYTTADSVPRRGSGLRTKTKPLIRAINFIDID